MHVLVTGGAGFIGSHVVDSLLAEGDEVTVLENFDAFYDRATKERNISDHRANPRWRLVEADLRDADALASHLIGDYDAIIHLAGLSNDPTADFAPELNAESNVQARG